MSDRYSERYTRRLWWFRYCIWLFTSSDIHVWDDTQVKTMIDGKDRKAFFRFHKSNGVFNSKGEPRKRDNEYIVDKRKLNMKFAEAKATPLGREMQIALRLVITSVRLVFGSCFAHWLDYKYPWTLLHASLTTIIKAEPLTIKLRVGLSPQVQNCYQRREIIILDFEDARHDGNKFPATATHLANVSGIYGNCSIHVHDVASLLLP